MRAKYEKHRGGIKIKDGDMKDDRGDGQRQEEMWEGSGCMQRQGGGEQSGLSGVLKNTPMTKGGRWGDNLNFFGKK